MGAMRWVSIGGTTLAVAGALLLVFCGRALAKVGASGFPEAAPVHAQLAGVAPGALLLAAGLILLICGWGVARRTRALPWRAKGMIILASLISAIAGALLLFAFRELHGDLYQGAQANSAEVAELLQRRTALAVERATGGFLALLCGQVLTGIGVGWIGWSGGVARRSWPLSFPLVLIGSLAAAAVVAAWAMAVSYGLAADAVAVREGGELGDFFEPLADSLVYSSIGAGFLIVASLVQAWLGFSFQTCKHS